jgi:hypothetical protein
LLSHPSLYFPFDLFSLAITTKPCIHLSSSPYVLHDPLNSCFSVSSPEKLFGEQ